MKKKLIKVFQDYDPHLGRARQKIIRDSMERPHYGDLKIYRVADDYHSVNLPLKPAAVLIPLVDRPEGMTVLLTIRAQHLKAHSGQVSFPGGKCESFDAHAMETALRETEEEVGIKRSHIQILGAMDDYETITGYVITPVIGIIEPSFDLVVDAGEVDEVFELPLDYFLNEANHELQNTILEDQTRYYYKFSNEKYHVWGATAAMLIRFAKLINGSH